MTLKDELERVLLTGSISLGEYAQPQFISKADQEAHELAKGAYRLSVTRYKETGRAEDYRKMLVTFDRLREVTRELDLRFSTCPAQPNTGTPGEGAKS